MADQTRRKFMHAAALSAPVALAVAAGSSAPQEALAQENNERQRQQLVDRLAITDVTSLLGMYYDQRNWDGVRQIITDPIELDYTSLFGGSPITVSADDLIATWTSSSVGWKATQHLVGNHIISIEGDTASCLSYVQATHFIPSDFADKLWTVGGFYTDELTRTRDGWRIGKRTFTATWGSGNLQLVTQAGIPPEP